MSKINCWKYKKCGREPGGSKTKELGVCSAAVFKTADGFCGGTNGGRACIFISGTLCGGITQGMYNAKKKHCETCDFYQKLKKEHGEEISPLSFTQYILK
jgi:hypothetical protein